MRLGRFPARDEAMRERIRQLRRHRRWFLGAAVAALGVGSIGGYVAGTRGWGVARASSPRVAWARELARGRLVELLGSYPAYCVVAEAAPSDSLVWAGMGRLGWAVVEAPELVRRSGVDSGRLARRLLRAFERRSGGARAVALVRELRARAEGR